MFCRRLSLARAFKLLTVCVQYANNWVQLRDVEFMPDAQRIFIVEQVNAAAIVYGLHICTQYRRDGLFFCCVDDDVIPITENDVGSSWAMT